MIDKLSWVVVYPEIILLVMACAIALIDLGVKTPMRGLTYGLTLFTLGGLVVLLAAYANTAKTTFGFSGMVVSDPMGNWLKCFATLALMVTLVYSRPYAAARDMMKSGELFVLSLFSLLGIYVMISGHNFLIIYLGLEILTLSSYALVALQRDNARCTEAAMKYFVLGALGSGFLLYGLSLVYGGTTSLDIIKVAEVVNSGQVNQQVLVLGLVFTVAGLAFKLGAAPFHMWIPDVYHGASTAVTLMIGSAPKLAAFAIVIRLLVESFLPLAVDWQQMLAVLAVASLFIGNFAAIAQTNLKRMLAFSTIAQMGFLLLAFVAGVVDGKTDQAVSAYGSGMFYVVSYVLTTLVGFGVILVLSRQGFESEEISDLSGLNQRSPVIAGIMSICMFSLAGVPPLVGFYAKFAVLEALISSGQVVYINLAIFAVIMSLIGAFYYLRVIKVMYFDAPSASMIAIQTPTDSTVVLSINGALILLLGIAPGGLMSLCYQSMVGLVK